MLHLKIIFCLNYTALGHKFKRNVFRDYCRTVAALWTTPEQHPKNKHIYKPSKTKNFITFVEKLKH